MAQNPASAEYDGTPRSVTTTGLVDMTSRWRQFPVGSAGTARE
jgi:chemotaxis response regulator CheB